MITVAALGIEPAALRERFDKCRFAAAVFADKKRDLVAKRQIDSVRESADVERIPGLIDLFGQALDSVEEWCARGSDRRGHSSSRLHRSTMTRGEQCLTFRRSPRGAC